MKNLRNTIPYVSFMMLSPLIAIIITFWDKKLSYISIKWILIIFVILFGSTLNFKQGADGRRFNDQVKEKYVEKSTSEFFSELYTIFLFKPTDVKGDAYIHILSFLTGGLLQLPQLFFPAVSLIYAFFYIGSIFKILSLFGRSKYSKIGIAFLLTFIAWKTVHDMQTVRTWTGFWILMYGVLGYLETKQKKYYLLLFLPPLFHFAYFVMALPCWLVMIAGNKKWIFTTLFLISFFTQIVPEQWALQQFRKVPLGAQKVEGYYTNVDERLKTDTGNKKSDQRFYAAFVDNNFNDYVVVSIALLLIISGLYFRYMGQNEATLFSTGILTKAFANGFFFIGALENRMAIVAGGFILAAITLFLLKINSVNIHTSMLSRKMKYVLWCIFICFTPFFLYKIAGFLGWASFFLIFFPFIPWLSEINFSIRDSIIHII